MAVSPLPVHGGICFDVRDDGRLLRVSAHPDTELVTISIWREDRCVATCQLDPREATHLLGVLANALAALQPTSASRTA